MREYAQHLAYGPEHGIYGIEHYHDADGNLRPIEYVRGEPMGGLRRQLLENPEANKSIAEALHVDLTPEGKEPE